MILNHKFHADITHFMGVMAWNGENIGDENPIQKKNFEGIIEMGSHF